MFGSGGRNNQGRKIKARGGGCGRNNQGQQIKVKHLGDDCLRPKHLVAVGFVTFMSTGQKQYYLLPYVPGTNSISGNYARSLSST